MPLCTIIGMGPGVSLSVARRFAREGYRIAMIARNPAKIQDPPADSIALTADAADEHALRAAIRQAGPADVLVYNASSLHAGPVAQLSTAGMLADFRVNVLGAAVAAQEVLPAMRATGRGTIFFTGGGLALDPAPGLGSLALGKSAIRNLAFTLAKENEEIHVATVTICGFVKPGTHFDPDTIAEEYWRLHIQPPAEWQTERIFR